MVFLKFKSSWTHKRNHMLKVSYFPENGSFRRVNLSRAIVTFSSFLNQNKSLRIELAMVWFETQFSG